MVATISITFAPPCKCTKAELEEWLNFILHDHSMSLTNPIYDNSPDLVSLDEIKENAHVTFDITE